MVLGNSTLVINKSDPMKLQQRLALEISVRASYWSVKHMTYFWWRIIDENDGTFDSLQVRLVENIKREVVFSVVVANVSVVCYDVMEGNRVVVESTTSNVRTIAVNVFGTSILNL